MKKNEDTSIDFIPKEIQELFDKMQLPNHHEATEAFFRATAEELNATYRDEFADKKTQPDQQN